MSDLTPITREEALLDGADLEPITRKEQFIKRIYDKTQEVPTPITREEWFLNKAGEGGGGVTVEQLNATENGTYSEQGKAYSPVIVEVPEPTLITKSITANGTYTASDDNADGYSQVTVAVEGFKRKSIANTPTDIASFNDGTANPMPSIEISIVPQQDLHGYENPWPAGGGKNLLDAKSVWNAEEIVNPSADTKWFFPSNLVGKQVTVSALIKSNSNNANCRIAVNIGGVIINSAPMVNDTSAFIQTKITATPQSTDDYLVLTNSGPNGTYKDLQVELGSTATSYAPYSNICPISGHTEANVTVTDDLTTPTETHTLSIPFHDSSDNPITVYGGRLNVTSGELTVTHANIASYNGETINEPWMSSMDVYSAGTTPTTGAQVVYPLATPQTYQLTPAQVTTLLNQNNIFADCGQILEGEYFVTL